MFMISEKALAAVSSCSVVGAGENDGWSYCEGVF